MHRFARFVRKEVAQKRQAYIVYPVIEGSKDDQPELDFSHDDPEAGIEPPSFAASQVSKASLGAISRKFMGKVKQRAPLRGPCRRPIRERNQD